MNEDLYEILGVDRSATAEQIRDAHRRLARRYHPDHDPGGTERFHEVQEAYEVLSDPIARAAYDQRNGNSGASIELDLGDDGAVVASSVDPWDELRGFWREVITPLRARAPELSRAAPLAIAAVLILVIAIPISSAALDLIDGEQGPAVMVRNQGSSNAGGEASAAEAAIAGGAVTQEAYLRGSWTGGVGDVIADSRFTVSLDQPFVVGAIAGSYAYPGDGCSGSLTLSGSGGGAFIFEEAELERPAACFESTVALSIRPQGGLHAQIEIHAEPDEILIGSSRLKGVLERS